MKVTKILCPLIRPEIPQLKNWLIYMPSTGVEGVSVYFLIDTIWSKEEKEELSDVFERSCFGVSEGVVYFVDGNLSKEESFYIKDSQVSIDLDRFPFGQKSGPNKQFFQSMKILSKKYHVSEPIFLLEVDAFPLVENWLALLNMYLAPMDESHTLLVGANYQGGSKLASQISDHLNGNAIYNLGSRYWKEFIDSWERLLLEAVKITPFVAYDVVIPWYINYSKTNIRVGNIDFSGLSRLVDNFHNNCQPVNKLIINYGGELENSNSYRLNEISFLRNHIDALVVHGKCFVRSIYLLRLMYFSLKECKHPVSSVFKAIENEKIDEAILSSIVSIDMIDHFVKAINDFSFCNLNFYLAD